MKYETIQRWDNSKPEVECEIARGEFNTISYRLGKIKARISAIIMAIISAYIFMRPSKKLSVFRVTGLNILGRVGTYIFF